MTPRGGPTIGDLAPRLRSRRLTSRELTESCLARIADQDPRLNAFITVLADRARREAREADAEMDAGRWRGPLHGVPISLKDLIDLAGAPTTAASRVLDGRIAGADAPVCARLREAGAVFVGKCNLHEFAFGTTCEDSAFGPVRNPWDTARTPGGSSGGSAAAIVAGMCAASIGTDTGGSIRIPAAACGCVGLKPTAGELPLDGIVALSWTLDHVGPLARSVADAWLLFQAMRGAAAPAPLPGGRGPASLGLGLLRPYFLDVLDDGVGTAFDRALSRIASAGAAMVERAVPHAGDIATVYLHLQLPEASAYHAEALERRPDLYTPAVRDRLELGRYIPAEDYARARQGALVLAREVDAALDGLDALVLPTLPIVAPPIGASSVDVGGASHPVRALMLRLTQLFDITGHPAVSIPCGLSAGRLPVGLQLVGRRGRTAELLEVAATVEATLDDEA